MGHALASVLGSVIGQRWINIGYGNVVAAGRIIAVVSPDSAPMKRLKDDARQRGKLVDATQGRRTRSIIVTDSDHVILSALQTETVAERLEKGIAPASEIASHAPPAAPEPTGGAEPGEVESA